MYVFDFITETTDAPLVCSLVDGVDDVGVQGFPFLEKKYFINQDYLLQGDTVEWCARQKNVVCIYPEHFVQGEFAQFWAHGGLCQLCDGIFGIFYTVTGLKIKNEQMWLGDEKCFCNDRTMSRA